MAGQPLYPSLDSLARQAQNPYNFNMAAPPSQAPTEGEGDQLQPMRDINEINRIRSNLKPGDSIVNPMTGEVTEEFSNDASGEIYPVGQNQDNAYLGQTQNQNHPSNNFSQSISSAPEIQNNNTFEPSKSMIIQGYNYPSSVLSSKLLDFQSSSSIKIDKSYGSKKTKFEIGANCSKAFENLVFYGSVDDQMLNGFSLKVLTLGIVNTRFSISFYCRDENNQSNSSEMDRKCLEISRPIGASNHIEVWFSSHGDWKTNKQKIGYVLPGSFDIGTIKFHVMSPQKVDRGTFKSGMARGLFSDDYTFIGPIGKSGGVKGAKMTRDGTIKFTDTGKQYDLHTKLLVMCAAIIMKTNI